ncbi:hypothetical protein [Parasynechococcus sp.]|jgi:hypothetical protein|uniref:hypothetical protein n=1 Tax=Parasynechococcus sp. TaxID=3101203 RepID=UPI003704897A
MTLSKQTPRAIGIYASQQIAQASANAGKYKRWYQLAPTKAGSGFQLFIHDQNSLSITQAA